LHNLPLFAWFQASAAEATYRSYHIWGKVGKS